MPLPQQRVTFEADVSARLGTPSYRTALDEYITAEVLPHVPDAWADYDKSRPNPHGMLIRHLCAVRLCCNPAGPPRCGNAGQATDALVSAVSRAT